jgi:folate-binding protein YgfZ
MPNETIHVADQCLRPSEPLDTAAQLHALLTGVGVSLLADYAWMRVAGADRVRWLNGMVTNSIQEMKDGDGSYNFALNAQGRIQADLYAFAHPSAIMVEADRARMPALIAMLDHFIIMDDVTLTDMSAAWAGIAIAGPGAAALLCRIGLESAEPIDAMPALRLTTATYKSAHLGLVHAFSPLVPRYEIWTDAATLDAIQSSLELAGATSCGPEALETLRLLEGTPRFGVDIRDKDLPQETAQTRALHFAKGCYLGQEIVERIRSRGNVHRTLSGFKLEGELPAELPAPLLATDPATGEAKPVGDLTSVARIPLPYGDLILALGTVRREALERAAASEGQPLTYTGGTASAVALPYAVAASNPA